MAKHPKKRRFRRYIRGEVDEDLDIATLGAKTLVSADFDETVNERTFVSSLDAIWVLSDMTAAANDGPILCGVAHSDYTDAEIEAFIEATASWNEGDLVAQEVGRRKIKKVGIFGRNGIDADQQSVLNDGKAIKTKLKWILLQGQGLKLWAYNMGDSPLGSPIPTVQLEGHANLWPQ